MEIKASCICSLNAIKALNHLMIFKKADPKKRMKLWISAFAILSVVIVLEMVVFQEFTDLIFLLVVNVLFIIWWLYLYYILPKLKYKAMANMKDVENEYVFYDDLIKVSSKAEGHNGNAEIKYFILAKVYETSEFLFLFQTNNQAFLVDKSTITGGTIEDLRHKLIGYLGNKYIICNY